MFGGITRNIYFKTIPSKEANPHYSDTRYEVHASSPKMQVQFQRGLVIFILIVYMSIRRAVICRYFITS